MPSIARRPSMARPSVIWSANSRSPPCGTPLAMRETLSPLPVSSRASKQRRGFAVDGRRRCKDDLLDRVFLQPAGTARAAAARRGRRRRAVRAGDRARSSGRAWRRSSRWPSDLARARRCTSRLASRRESRHTGHSARPFSSTCAMLPQRSQRFTASPSSCREMPSSRAVLLSSRSRRTWQSAGPSFRRRRAGERAARSGVPIGRGAWA